LYFGSLLNNFLNLIKNIGKTHVIVDRFLISDDVLFTNFYKESLKIRKIISIIIGI